MPQGPAHDELIDRLYEAVLDPGLWTDVITEMSDLVGAHQAIMLTSDVVTGSSTAVTCRRLELSAISNFFSYYMFVNPLVLVSDADEYAAGWQPRMLRDEDCLERPVLERTEYYNDYLYPLDAGYMLCLRLGLEGRTLHTISLGNSRSKGRFEDEAMNVMAAIHPHAIRAARLSRRFAELQGFATGATRAMEAASEPLLLLDSLGRLVHVNEAAERMLAAQTLVRTLSGRLVATHELSAPELASAIARAAGSAERCGGAVVLLDVAGRRIAQASILPISLETGFQAAGGPAVLVRIAPLADEERLGARMDGFGLTRAERALALALVDGQTLRTAALARGISPATARVQLASIFAKTGVNRQVDLVRILTRSS